jgi:hypothetical protein
MFRAKRVREAQAVGMMPPPPSAWGSYEPALFRLAGFGGAGLFLRTSVFPDERGAEVLGVDIGLLSVESFVWLLSREADGGLSAGLSAFFIAVAGEDHPEVTIGPFRNDLLGLECAVVASDAVEVELLVRVDPDQELLLRTTRAAVMQAGLDARRLEDVNADLDVSGFPSPEWF